MRTNTFAHLEALCEAKGIVCERRRGRIELTTPNGGTTAECESVAEALDTYRNDDTFSSLPFKLVSRTEQVRRVESCKSAPELYEYTVHNESGIAYRIQAASLTEACSGLSARHDGVPFTPMNVFSFCGTVLVNRSYIYGVRWDKVS